jgi:calmodulin
LSFALLQVDFDASGTIDFAEYLNMMSPLRTGINDQKEIMMSAFRVFDKDKDGCISRSEVKQLAYILEHTGDKLSGSEVRRAFDKADIDGDGKLDYAEFVHIMTRSQFGEPE